MEQTKKHHAKVRIQNLPKYFLIDVIGQGSPNFFFKDYIKYQNILMRKKCMNRNNCLFFRKNIYFKLLLLCLYS